MSLTSVQKQLLDCSCLRVLSSCCCLQLESPREPSFKLFVLLASILWKACQGVQQHNAVCSSPQLLFSLLSPPCASVSLSHGATLQLKCTNPYRSIKVLFCLQLVETPGVTGASSEAVRNTSARFRNVCGQILSLSQPFKIQ